MSSFERSSGKTDPITEATRRLEQNPRDVLALIQRANAYLERHDVPAVLSDVDRALQLVLSEPQLEEDTQAVLLARLYTTQSQALAGGGSWEQALSAAERAVQARPDDLDALVQRGRVRRQLGDMPGALSDLNHVIALNPTMATAYLARGILRYDGQGDSTGALEDFNRALELDGSLAVAWSRRGQVYMDMNDLVRAEQDLRLALSLDIRLSGAYTNLCAVLRLQNRPDEALRIAANALRYYPDDPGLLVEAARCLIDQNRLPEALSTVQKVLAQLPDHAEALALMGQVYGRQGNIVAAVHGLERALALNPHDVESWFNCALAHYHAGNAAAALAAIDRVLALNPEDGEARSFRQHISTGMPQDHPELVPVLAVLERFAFAHCGPRYDGEYRWRVGTLPMTQFTPHGAIQSYVVAALDLCQAPYTIIAVWLGDNQIDVSIRQARLIPEIQQQTLATVLSATIPARSEALSALLNRFMEQGMLAKAGASLRFTGKT